MEIAESRSQKTSAKEKPAKEIKNSHGNVKLDKKGNPRTVIEPAKSKKDADFSRPRVVNQNPAVKITDNLKIAKRKSN